MRNCGFALAWIGSVALFLSGCGGSMSHSVSTPYKGSVRGAIVDPPHGSRDVSTRVKPTVSWRDPEEPPAVFTLSLKMQKQGDDFDPVPTRLEQIGNKAWRLRPTYPLSNGTLYAVVVSSGTERLETWFITEEFRIFRHSSEEEHDTPSSSLSEANEIHVIHYKGR